MKCLLFILLLMITQGTLGCASLGKRVMFFSISNNSKHGREVDMEVYKYPLFR